MAKHTFDELKQWQALPLEIKVRMSMQRIRDWVREYGEDGVYISFSGGKDSTVLSHLVDRTFPGNSIPRVFVNTGLEYPEIVKFVKEEPRAVLIRPAMNFKKVIQQYGYPFISKETAEALYWARRGKQFGLDKIYGTGKRATSQYKATKWKFMMEDGAPPVSHMCCLVMKKRPSHKYAHETKRCAITGEMAAESRLRAQKWVEHGCNMYDAKIPKSMPMAFWTTQDVLLYIMMNEVKICSAYGDIVKCDEPSVVPGQLSLDFAENPVCLKTTGCDRTGCMFCGFGCHLDKRGEGKFLRMKQTHPKIYEWIMKPTDQGGLGYKEVIDWINEHGNLHIEY